MSEALRQIGDWIRAAHLSEPLRAGGREFPEREEQYSGKKLARHVVHSLYNDIRRRRFRGNEWTLN